jgi:hypothetical protein
MKRIYSSLLFTGIFALQSSVAIATIPWDITLDMELDPWSDSPSWGGNQNMGGYFGTRIWGQPIGADGYYREIDTSASAGDSMNFSLSDGNFDPNFDTGHAMETQLRIHNGTIPGGHGIITISDGDGDSAADGFLAIAPYYRFSGGWQVGFRVDNSQSQQLIDVTDIYTPFSNDGGTTWEPTSWLKVHVNIVGGIADIFVNGQPRLTVDVGNPSFTPTEDSTWFGDGSSGAAGLVDYDYVWHSYVPEPSTLSLLACAAAIFAVRRRRA